MSIGTCRLHQYPAAIMRQAGVRLGKAQLNGPIIRSWRLSDGGRRPTLL